SAAMPALIAASSSSVGDICPGLSFGILSFLPLVGLAQADEATDIAAVSVNRYMQPLADVADGAHALFAIGLSIVLAAQCIIPFKRLGIRHGDTMLGLVRAVLALIVGDLY